MIYSEDTKKAYHLMYNAHRNQVDKGGVPYVFHPLFVAEQMDDEKSTIVALLHDTIEDTYVTKDYLLEQGFSQEIIDAIVVLTHKKYEPYMDYIKRVSQNKLAEKVKMADLKHNSDLSRLKIVTEKDKKRVAKYKRAIEYLSLECNEEGQ